MRRGAARRSNGAAHGSDASYRGRFSAWRSAFDDRRRHGVAPFGPRTVVVLYLGEAQQVMEHEPGMARPLSNAAIGDDGSPTLEAPLLHVERLQLLDGAEAAILLRSLGPGNTY